MAYGAVAMIGDAADRVISPAKGVIESLPLAKIVFDPTWGEKFIQRADEHKREKQNKRLEKQRKYEEMTRPTNR